MAKRQRVMTSDNVIDEPDGDDYFLDKLDDPQEPVLLESDLQEIGEDNH